MVMSDAGDIASNIYKTWYHNKTDLCTEKLQEPNSLSEPNSAQKVSRIVLRNNSTIPQCTAN
jgi:hypothetical protein